MKQTSANTVNIIETLENHRYSEGYKTNERFMSPRRMPKMKNTKDMSWINHFLFEMAISSSVKCLSLLNVTTNTMPM